MNEEHFYGPVVGVTFDGRQNVAAKLFMGEALTLRRELSILITITRSWCSGRVGIGR